MAAACVLWTSPAFTQEKPVPVVSTKQAQAKPAPRAYSATDIATNPSGNAPVLIKDEATAKTTATSVELALSPNPALMRAPK